MVVLGFAPLALVLQYYNVLSNRTTIRWDLFGNTTIIGTRPATILAVAVAGAIIAVAAVLVAVWQRGALSAFGLKRAYLALNLAQLAVIALTCCMIVSDALGFHFKIKPMIPPAMSVLLFAAGVLFWRLEGKSQGLLRWFAGAMAVAGLGLLAFSAIAMDAAVGYYAAAFALLAMVAIALPERAG